MPTTRIILLIAAVILFLVAALGVNSGRVNLVALGLACLAGSQLVP
jgi:hypothetical protein